MRFHSMPQFMRRVWSIMTILWVRNVLHRVAGEITLNQNNGPMRWSQGTSTVNVFKKRHILLCCCTIYEVPNLRTHPFLVPFPLPTYRFWQVGWLIENPACLFSKFCSEGHSGSVFLAKSHGPVSSWVWEFDFPWHEPRCVHVYGGVAPQVCK